MNIRNAVVGGWEAGLFANNVIPHSPVKRLTELGILLRLGMEIGRMCARPRKLDIDKLVDEWEQAVVGMCTAHEKDEYDAHDAKSDQLLRPILTAPIKQVREFYLKLQQRLRENKKVPLLVWMGFEAWGECVVKGADNDKRIIRLRDGLAKEIADLVSDDVAGQLPKAIVRALRWRDQETLGEVKEALVGGAKPKLVGRQSCLFLEVGRGKKKRSVML